MFNCLKSTIKYGLITLSLLLSSAYTHAVCVYGQWQAPGATGENGAPLRLESDHFAIYWKDGTNISMSQAQQAASTLESIWNVYFGSQVNFQEPYCNGYVPVNCCYTVYRSSYRGFTYDSCAIY